MALSAKLQLRQTQSLVMTPQLMQSIRLLQLTHVELERFIDEEIERNPLLERAEPPQDGPGEPEQAEAAAQPEAAAADGDWFEAETEWSAEAISAKLDSSLENLFPDDPGTAERLGPDLSAQWKSAPTGNSAGEGFDMEDMAAARVRCATMSESRTRFLRESGRAADCRRLADGWTGRLSAPDPAESPRAVADADTEAALWPPAALRPDRQHRDGPGRVPVAAACRTRPLDPAMQACWQSGAAGAARLRGVKRLRRRRGGSSRHAGRDPRARSASGPCLFRRRSTHHRRRRGEGGRRRKRAVELNRMR